MSVLVLVFIAAFSMIAFVLAFWLYLEAVAAVLAFRKRDVDAEPASLPPAPFAVIVPAHNEAPVIAATIANIKSQMRACDRLLIVADNCTDETGAVARGNGAEVIERHDEGRCGKGYALQFGLDWLRDAPPALVVFTDADCAFSKDALLSVVAAAERAGRPAQALYLMHAEGQAGPKMQVAEFAWLFMNNVRMRGLFKLAGVTRFTGAGFAAPWRVLADLDLASGEIVEDLALSMELVKNKAAPVFHAPAIVTSTFPNDEQAQTRQAARWSIGSIRYAAQTAVTSFIEGIGRGRWRQVALALDLMIPPLTVFTAFLLAVNALSLLGWLATGAAAPFALAFVALALTVFSVILGWSAFGREALPLSALGGGFQFLLSKLNVFGAKGRDSTKRWTPTRGGSDGAGE
ncbi:MAG: glycosyltransferase family 2 protein [Pseudomonadota bacterium]